MFEQDAQLREFAQILDRYRRDLKAALAFGDDKAFRGEPVQDLAQRRDADAVVLLPEGVNTPKMMSERMR
jgi:hypothetical protein